MNRLLLAGAFACLLHGHAWAIDSDGTRPDDRVTPGEIRTRVWSEICGHTTKEFRHVTPDVARQAMRNYGIATPRAGYCAGKTPDGRLGCEKDHRVPLVVGGDNKPGSSKNLWLQRPDGPFGYTRKDLCEERVGKDLCARKISVADAQAVFLGDWRVTCKPWVPDLPDLH